MEKQNQVQTTNTTAVATTQPKSITYSANGQEVTISRQMVINYLTRGNGAVKESEVVNFIYLCKYNALNPFLGEAYLIKFGTTDAQMVVSAEALRKRAESNEHYKGAEYGIIILRNNEIQEVPGTFMLKTDELLGAWAKIYRNDRELPYYVSITFDEYNKGQSSWKTMKATMIAKCALSKALRECFPMTIGGMISSDEVNANIETQPVTGNNRTERLRIAMQKQTPVINTQPVVQEPAPVEVVSEEQITAPAEGEQQQELF